MKQPAPVRRECLACQHWMRPDPSPEHISNAGICIAFMPDSGVRGDPEGNWPFWARGLSYRTFGWQGSECNRWRKRTRGNGFVSVPTQNSKARKPVIARRDPRDAF